MSTTRAVRRVYDRFLGELGLNLTEASILAHLNGDDGLTQTELARRIGSSRARVGVHIDGLQEKGAVERRSDPADRRVWMVHLTDAGRSLHERSVQVDRHVRRHLRAGTTAEERELLDRLLASIQRNAENIPDPNEG
jgi:MarR family transcriptional regulator, transcriptional regulator for hemolysin